MTATPSAPPAPAPPAAPTPAAAPTCPKCGAAVGSDDKFCPKCGASLAAIGAAPAPAGAPPVDIRQKVDQDRGFLKRVQLLIPGFRGYRLGEDIRAADNLLRLQVADKVHQSVAAIQDWRTSLTNAGQFQVLTGLSDALADLMKLEGEIRHAEQGYTGISPSVRIRPEQLDSLYQYDYGFAQAANSLLETLAPIRQGGTPSFGADATAALQTVRDQVRALDAAFKARRNAVEGILVP